MLKVLKQLFIEFQELFIQKLAQDALKGQRHFRHLEYNDLARAVEDNENMYFLRGNFFLCMIYNFISNLVILYNDSSCRSKHKSTWIIPIIGFLSKLKPYLPLLPNINYYYLHN